MNIKIRGKKLKRSQSDKVIAGVIGGFAEAIGANSFVLRAIYILFTIITHFWIGVGIYVLAVLFIPLSNQKKISS